MIQSIKLGTLAVALLCVFFAPASQARADQVFQVEDGVFANSPNTGYATPLTLTGTITINRALGTISSLDLVVTYSSPVGRLGGFTYQGIATESAPWFLYASAIPPFPYQDEQGIVIGGVDLDIALPVSTLVGYDGGPIGGSARAGSSPTPTALPQQP